MKQIKKNGAGFGIGLFIFLFMTCSLVTATPVVKAWATGGSATSQKNPPTSPETNVVDKKNYNVETDPQWIADSKRIDGLLRSGELSDEEECTTVWNIIWSWAKKGNLHARAWLFFYVYPIAPHSPSILMPGSAGDEISHRRDALILAINSVGAYSDAEDLGQTYKFASDMLYTKYLNDGMRGSAFLQCLKESPAQDCTRRAVEAGFFPSFDKYAAQIDAFLAQGMKPKCGFHSGPQLYQRMRMRKTRTNQ